MRRSSVLGMGFALVLAMGLGSDWAAAATYVWTPATTGLTQWASGANWSSTPVGAVDTRLTFVDPNSTTFQVPGSTTMMPSNDIAGDFRVNLVDLQGTFTSNGLTLNISIPGSPLLFGVNGTSTPTVNLNASYSGNPTFNYNLNTPVKLDSSIVFQGGGIANFFVNGPVTDNTGTNSLTKNGNAKLTLGGNNSYAGVTTVNGGTMTLSGSNTTTGAIVLNAGTLNLNHARALGSGALTIGGTSGSKIDNTTGGNLVLANNNTQYWNADFTYAATQNRNLDLGTGSITLSTNRKVTVNSTVSLTAGGSISGPGLSLEKAGTGTLVLSGANTYSGGTLVNGGTLIMSNANALGSSGIISFGGGTLKLLDSTDISARFSQAAGQSYSVETPSNVTFATALTSAGGSLTKKGAAKLILSTPATYAGPTTVSAGTLTFSGSGTLPGAAALVISGGILDLGPASPMTVGAVTLTSGTISNGTLNGTSYAASGTASVYANLGGSGVGLTESGGTLTLGGVNTYTGDTTVYNGGTLQLDFSGADSPNNDVINSASAWKVGNGTVTIDCETRSGFTKSQTANGLTVNAPGATALRMINGSTGSSMRVTLGAITRNAGSTLDFTKPSGNTNITANNGFLTTAANDASGILGGWATVAGTDWAASDGTSVVPYAGYTTLSGVSPVIVDGPNSNVRLDGSSTGDVGQAVGTVTVNTLLSSVARTNTLATGSTLRFGPRGGILTTAGALTFGAAGNAGTITAGGADDTAGELIINCASNVTLYATVADNGAGVVGLTKAGNGRLTLATNSTYTGNTFLNAGSLYLAGGVNPLTTNGGFSMLSGYLDLGGGRQTNAANFVLYAGTITNGTIVKTGSNFDIRGGTVYASLAGAVGLDKTGSGSLTLYGPNTYTGDTTVREGSITAGIPGTSSSANGTIAVAGNLIVGSPTGGPAVTVSAASYSTPFTAGKTFTVYTNCTLNFNNAAQYLSGSLYLYGGTFSGSQPYFNFGSAVYMTGGTLGGAIYGNNGFAITSYSNATAAVVSAGIQANNHTFTVANGPAAIDLLFSGYMSGAYVLTKAGAGVMSITGTGNSYSGGTALSAGTLLVNNTVNSGSGFGSGIGLGTITVAAGATLGGSGFIGGISASYTNANVVLSNGASTNSMATIWPGTVNATNGDQHVIGTLSVGSDAQTNNVTFGSYGRLMIAFDAAGNHDMLVVKGSLNLTSTTDRIEFSIPPGGINGGAYTVATADVINGVFNATNGVPNSKYRVETTATTIQLVVPPTGTRFIIL